MGSFGKCKKCPPNARETRLFGDGVCGAHLHDETIDIPRDEKITTASKKAEKKMTQDAWFKSQRKHIPMCCENCNKPIQPSIPKTMTWKTAVCHILPKEIFISVMVNALNRWFGCWQCHNDYDKRGAAFQAKMQVAEICKERFQQFKDQIPASELRRVPEWLLK